MSVLAYVGSLGIAIAVAVPLHRMLRRGSARFGGLMAAVALGVAAIAVFIAVS